MLLVDQLEVMICNHPLAFEIGHPQVNNIQV